MNIFFNYNYMNEISNNNMLALLSSNLLKIILLIYNVNITPKMFRTWYANYHMLDYLKILKIQNFIKITVQMKKNYQDI